MNSAILFSDKIYLDRFEAKCRLLRLGLKQKEVARLLKISPPQLCQHLNSQTPIQGTTLASLMCILKVDNPSKIISMGTIGVESHG